MDTAAYNVLQTLDPQSAANWKSLFEAAGLLGANGTSGGIGIDDLLHMDIDTLLLVVFGDRADEVETELKNQILYVQQQNDVLAKLNSLLGTLNAVQSGMGPSPKATDVVQGNGAANNLFDQYGDKINDAIDQINAGLTSGTIQLFPNPTTSTDPTGTNPQFHISGTTTYPQVSSAIETLKGMIDSLSTNQQMDMVKLQTMTSRRNECYELMTNNLEKATTTKSGIVSNMR